MTFEEIAFTNYGPFVGHQTIDLSPDGVDRPVVVVHGLNGAGKTSLLDSIQLALYGKRANLSKKRNSYDSFLAGAIHRDAAPGAIAAVELQFTMQQRGALVRYRVRREWRLAKNGVAESLTVWRDGEEDRFLTGAWAEHVEELLPSGLTHLVLFDGEKIEQMAHPDSARNVVRTGIHALLGLDIVTTLESDLVAVERKVTRVSVTEVTRDKIVAAETELQRVDAEVARLWDEAATLRTILDNRLRERQDLQRQMHERGGDLWERRQALESTRKERAAELDDLRAQLVDAAGGALPFLVCGRLLRGLRDRQIESEARRDQQEFVRLTQLFAAKLVEALPRQTSEPITSADLIRATRSLPETTGSAHAWTMPAEVSAALTTVDQETLAGERAEAAQLVERSRSLQADLETLDRQLAAVPSEEQVAQLIANLTACNAAIDEAQRNRAERLEQHEASIELGKRLRLRFADLERAARDEAAALEDAARIASRAEETRGILKRFQSLLIERHAASIAVKVEAAARTLLRKQHLIHGVEISPTTLDVLIKKADGTPFLADELSAGERQLFAVAVLWGLSQASSRPLPAIIDTPLSRLDKGHRHQFVQQYLAHASHQVIVLTTDTEVVGPLLESIRPRVAREYTLIGSTQSSATTIHQGFVEVTE